VISGYRQHFELILYLVMLNKALLNWMMFVNDNVSETTTTREGIQSHRSQFQIEEHVIVPSDDSLMIEKRSTSTNPSEELCSYQLIAHIVLSSGVREDSSRRATTDWTIALLCDVHIRTISLLLLAFRAIII
jgi:hypothetical protein